MTEPATLRLVTGDESPRQCGHYGGVTRSGQPCRRPAGWGLETADGPCSEHVHTAAVPEGVRPPPAHLSNDSAALWREVTSLYQFGPEGYPILEHALEARDRARDAREEIARVGVLFVNRDSGVAHANPLLRVERDSWTAFRLAWKQLDLDISPPEEDR